MGRSKKRRKAFEKKKESLDRYEERRAKKEQLRKKGGGPRSAPSGSSSAFEIRGNGRAKHKVFGRKNTNQHRNVITARSDAVNNRKRTLLVEYKANKKANTFIDRRLGENTEGLDEEDKMLLRLQRQRERQFRKHRYNLNVADDKNNTGGGMDNGNRRDIDTLTHFGQSLGADDFDMQGEGRLSDDSDGELDAELVDKTHFGGGVDDKQNDDDADRPKTRREILQDIIRKSKVRKAERAKEKDERDEERAELDAELEGIKGLLDFGGNTNKKREKKTKQRRGDDNDDGDYDDYDRMTRELAREHRAQATDRMRTPAEIARAERAKLQHLEEQRLIRMRGDADDEEEEEEESRTSVTHSAQGDEGEGADGSLSKREKREKRRREMREEKFQQNKRSAIVGGDDLDSNFIVDPEFAPAASSDDEEAEEEDDDDNEGASKRGEDEESNVVDEDAGKVSKRSSNDSGPLPYIFDLCPRTRDDLERLLRKWSAYPLSSKERNRGKKTTVSSDEEDDTDRSERAKLLLERVRVSHSALVDASNEPKLRDFLTATLEVLAAHCEDSKRTFCPWFVSALIRSVWTCAQELDVSDTFRERVENAQQRLSTSSQMPSIATLLDFRTIVCIYSCSDFRHAIATPAMMVMGQFLAQATAKSGVEVLSGLCVVETMLRYTRDSKRYLPECVAFLSALLSRVAIAVTGPQSEEADEWTSDLALARSSLLGAPKCCPKNATLLLRSTEAKERVNATISKLEDALENGAFALLCSELRNAHDEDESGKYESSLLPPAALLVVVRLLRRLAASQATQSYFRSAFELPVAALRLIQRAQKSRGGGSGDRLRRDEKRVTKTSEEGGLRLPDAIVAAVSEALRFFDLTAEKAESARGDLRMKIHRPVAIRQMMPRFDEEFDPSRNMDPDRVRVAMKQMKRSLARERKNTTRELRRDNAFLAREREKEIEARDARLEARQKEVMQFLQEQQRTFKEMVKTGNAYGGGSGGGGRKTKKRQFG
eukprot:g1533.t1